MTDTLQVGHVEGKDDADMLKCCTIINNDGVRQQGCLRKTWWNRIVLSLGVSLKT